MRLQNIRSAIAARKVVTQRDVAVAVGVSRAEERIAGDTAAFTALLQRQEK